MFCLIYDRRFLRGGVFMEILHNMFNSITSLENILQAWSEFSKGKRKRKDVQEFSVTLFDNIFLLHKDLVNQRYAHGPYEHFRICDPKPRDIHKASVRDRIVHRAVYRILYPYFDKTFISDSYSCRNKKGTHKALRQFESYVNKVTKNNTKQCWVLKCDIRKFFATIDHKILLNIIRRDSIDEKTMMICGEIIKSFSYYSGKGLPLGNLTSQLFSNIYMNELDKCIKHILKIKYYIRYADDFIILDNDYKKLEYIVNEIQSFLLKDLRLELHPQKIFIKTIYSGVDFLGWVHFVDHRVLRTSTKRRMFSNTRNNNKKESYYSYKGLLSHGNAYKLARELERIKDNPL